MVYVFALVLLVTIGFVIWRIAASPRGGTGAARQQAPRGPDDDPDFLRKLNGPH